MEITKQARNGSFLVNHVVERFVESFRENLVINAYILQTS